MSGWEKVEIGAVADVYDGPHATPPPCEKSNAFFIGIPHVTPSGHLDLSQPRYIAETDFPKWTKRVTPRFGDVVFSYEATLNLYALIPENLKCCLGRRMGLVRPKPDKLDSNFLYYYFFSNLWRREVQIRTIVGATVDRLPIADFPGFPIYLPPLAEQRRIAGVLRAYDEAIENCRRQISLLEEAAQRLYRNRFLSGNEDNWESVSILDNDVFRFVSPKVTPFRGEKLYYATADVDGTGIVGQGEFVSFDNRPSRASIQPIPNSVWFARMSNSYKILCFIEGCGGLENRCIISSGFAGFSSAPEHFGYVYCTIASRLFDEMKNRFATGATQVSLTNEGLGKISVRLPPREAIRDFSSIVLPYLMNAELLRCQIKSFSEARDRLLPRLMSGEASA